MDTAQWPEGIGVVKSSMDQEKKAATGGSGGGVVGGSASSSSRAQALIKPQALNCPRCHSTHTKFCYYNNYSLSQPRYFCKTCRRYWTEGGSLRNVPVGGGSRKNKRSSSSSPSNISSASSSSSKNNNNNKLLLPPTTNSSYNSSNPLHNHHHHNMGVQVPVQVPQSFSVNPSLVDQASCDHHQDLNLKYPPNSVSEFLGLPPNNSSSSSQFSAMEFLKNGINGGSLMMSNPFLQNIPVSHDHTNPMIFSTTVLQGGNGNGNVGSLSFQEFAKSTAGGLNFTLDGFESRYGGSNGGGGDGGGGGGGAGGVLHESTSAGARFFPFEDLRPVSTSTDDHDHQDGGQQAGDHHSSGGYWNNGGLGGGSW